MSRMTSGGELQRQYITLLAGVTKKQAILKQLDKERAVTAATLRAAEERKKKSKQQQERDDGEAKRLRMCAWQYECSSIILQKENMAIGQQFDKREYLVKLGILETRLRKLQEKWENVKLLHHSNPQAQSASPLQAMGDHATPLSELPAATDERYREVYQQLQLLHDELRVMYGNVCACSEQANKSAHRRPGDGQGAQTMASSDNGSDNSKQHQRKMIDMLAD